MAQDGKIGNGFGTNNWSTVDNFSPSAGGSMILTTFPNGTGNRYFRLISGGFQLSPSAFCVPGEDQLVSLESEFIANNNNCGNGAWYINCPNTTDQYIFKTPSFSSNRFISFRVQGTVRSILGVVQTPSVVFPSQSVTVSANVSGVGPLPAGQGIYLRYTTNGWTNSTVVEMTYSGSGQQYTATLPALVNVASTNVNYYVFTSGDGMVFDASKSDWYTINLNNNSGSNFGYMVQDAWTTRPGGDQTWDDPNMWDALAVPPSGVPVRIQDAITLDMNARVSSIIIEAGAVFTASDASSRNLSIASNGFLTNNGTYLRRFETLSFLGGGLISGQVAANNITTRGGLNPGTQTTVHGSLTILSGGFISNNPVSYALGSTLVFDVGNTFNLYGNNLEWNAAVTPHHLQINAGTQLWLWDDLTRTLGGNLTLSGAGSRFVWEHNHVAPSGGVLRILGNLSLGSGAEFNVFNGDGNGGFQYDVRLSGSLDVGLNCSLYLNQDIGDDLYIIGNLTNNGIFNSSNRLVALTGAAPQYLTGNFTGTSVFHYLQIDNPSSVVLNNDIEIEDDLRLSRGLVLLGPNDLILGLNATVSGTPSSSAMVVPDAAGALIKRIGGPSSVLFPVGERTGVVEYSPVVLNVISASFSSNPYVSVKLADEKHPLNPAIVNFLTRHWTVEQNDISAIQYNIDFQYLDADINGVETNIEEIKSNDGGMTWNFLGFVDDVTNKISLQTQSSFSVFTGGETSALPVQLAEFAGKDLGGQVELYWSTLSEVNSDYFLVEHQDVSNNWVPVIQESAVGNHVGLQRYRALHLSPRVGLNHYRLTEIDREGTLSVLGVAAVYVGKTGDAFAFFDGAGNLVVENIPENEHNLEIRLHDVTGRILLHLKSLDASAGSLVVPFEVDLASQTVYLQLNGSQGLRSVHKLIRY